MPIVSVLMGVFNGERHIAEAIQSLRDQTFADWELVVVDDGSTDGTLQLLRTAAATDARVLVIALPESRGLGAALNAARQHASGEFLARMDADDRALPERLEMQKAFLEAHADVDVLGTIAYNIDSAGNRTGIETRPERHQEMADLIYRINPLIHPSVMLRSRVFDALCGYDERFVRAQDYDLWLRAYRRFRFHNLQAPLLEYRQPPFTRWRSSCYSARAVWNAGVREGRVLRGAFYGLRQLVAFGYRRVSQQHASRGQLSRESAAEGSRPDTP